MAQSHYEEHFGPLNSLLLRKYAPLNRRKLCVYEEPVDEIVRDLILEVTPTRAAPAGGSTPALLLSRPLELPQF